MPSRWAPSRRVVSKTWKSRSVGTRRSWGDGSSRQTKRPPGVREVCAQSGTDCALGDNDRAGGGHRRRVNHAGLIGSTRPAENRMSLRGCPCYPCAVIPSSWTPVPRPTDGERVGYLVPDGADGSVVPTTLVGRPLAPATGRADAVALLVERGLRSL